jgi:hypothetical protein
MPKSADRNAIFLSALAKMPEEQLLDAVVLPSADMAHVRQSRPDSGLGFQANALDTF